MQADVRRCPRSILLAAVCDCVTPSRGGREGEHNTDRHKQNSATSEVYGFMLICFADVNTFAYMLIYMGTNTSPTYKHRHKEPSHLHYIITFLSLLNCLYSWTSQGALQRLHKGIWCCFLSLCCL